MLCSVCYKGYLFGRTTTMTTLHLNETVWSFLILIVHHHKKSRAASCWRVLGGKTWIYVKSREKFKVNWKKFTKAALKHLLNDYHCQSSAYLIIQPSLLWLSIVESAANGEYYFVSLLKLAIFRDQGHIREVVAVRDASHRNLSTIPIPPPRQAFVLSTKFFSRPPPCLYTCSSIWPS